MDNFDWKAKKKSAVGNLGALAKKSFGISGALNVEILEASLSDRLEHPVTNTSTQRAFLFGSWDIQGSFILLKRRQGKSQLKVIYADISWT